MTTRWQREPLGVTGDIFVWQWCHHHCNMSGLNCLIPILAAVWKVCSCVRVCVYVWVHQCVHVAFVHFFVHVHALPFLLDGTIKMNYRVQSIFPSLCSCLVIVMTVLSLLSKTENYLCLYAKSQLLYSREMLHKFWSGSSLEWLQHYMGIFLNSRICYTHRVVTMWSLSFLLEFTF